VNYIESQKQLKALELQKKTKSLGERRPPPSKSGLYPEFNDYFIV